MTQLSENEKDHLYTAFAKAADDILAAGNPIGLDTIIIIARKKQSSL
jgi:hypothetical protein